MIFRICGFAATLLYFLIFSTPLLAQEKIRHPLDLGKATIQSTGFVVAGSFATITYTFIAGHQIDESDFIKISFRSIGDFGAPQFEQPTMSNYCTVYSTGDVLIEPRWENTGYPPSPFGQSLYLQVKDGFLDRGEKIVVVFGDTSGKSLGWQMQTFVEKTFEFKTFRVRIPVDPVAPYEINELPESPTLHIAPGKPVRAVCIAPSQIEVNEEFTYHLRLEDEWGNPTDKPVKMVHSGFSKAGVQTIVAKDTNTDLSARSNPIKVLTEPAEFNPYWADFHGQSEENDVNNLEDYYTFARDYGLLDISAHQSNDKFLTYPFWQEINDVADKFYEPGKFLTFPGYEWSAYESMGGHRNVYYTSQSGGIFHSRTDFPILPENNSLYQKASTAPELYEYLKNEENPQAFVFEHCHSTIPSIHDPSLELAVEVHSGWGTFEWIVEDALRLGHRIGVVANGDGHRVRPGAEYPSANKDTDGGAIGGLTCVFAPNLDRSTIYDAVKARHMYATTGIRALIDVKVVTEEGNSAMMGDVISADTDTPRLYVSVTGTSSIESVEIKNGPEVISTVRPFQEEDLGNRVKIIWGGIEDRGDGRQGRAVYWNGKLRVQSNTINGVTPVNFWNVNKPLKVISENQLEWESFTTGNEAGMIITLNNINTGTLEIETLQGNVSCLINSIGLEPIVWEYGGLQKRIEAYRLPDEPDSRELSFSFPLTELHEGDNPIYIRMTQEDGQMAWTSPIYVERNSDRMMNE